MKILSINAGSSTVKFQLYEMPQEEVIVSANFERIGLDKSFYSIKINGKKTQKDAILNTHEDAVKFLLQELLDFKLISTLDEIGGIGHRVVHGADKYSSSIVITDEVVEDIKNFSSLAPLHNPANLLGINVIRKLLPNLKNVAVFDTAFHQTMEDVQYIYPVPYEWYTNYKVRKYGFHGTSHKYVSQKISSVLNKEDLKVITCHLGNGGSISAIKNGKCVSTSMGFTPLAGISMGTRSGDIDPSIIPYVMEQSNKSLEEVMSDLNKKSGYLGISGFSSDSRDIKSGIDRNDERCILAEQLFVNRIVSYIASYYVLLNGADVITFAGGIGERAPHTRKTIIEGLSCLNIYLDEEANESKGELIKISNDQSKVLCYVVPTDEELMIVKDTYELIK